MTTQPAKKYAYQDKGDGLKVIYKNGNPIAALHAAPLEVAKEYPNVVALSFPSRKGPKVVDLGNGIMAIEITDLL